MLSSFLSCHSIYYSPHLTSFLLSVFVRRRKAYSPYSFVEEKRTSSAYPLSHFVSGKRRLHTFLVFMTKTNRSKFRPDWENGGGTSGASSSRISASTATGRRREAGQADKGETDQSGVREETDGQTYWDRPNGMTDVKISIGHDALLLRVRKLILLKGRWKGQITLVPQNR